MEPTPAPQEKKKVKKNKNKDTTDGITLNPTPTSAHKDELGGDKRRGRLLKRPEANENTHHRRLGAVDTLTASASSQLPYAFVAVMAAFIVIAFVRRTRKSQTEA